MINILVYLKQFLLHWFQYVWMRRQIILEWYKILNILFMWKKLSIQQWILRKYYPIESYWMM